MRKLLGRLYVWVRFGKITSRSVEFLNGHEAEIDTGYVQLIRQESVNKWEGASRNKIIREKDNG